MEVSVSKISGAVSDKAWSYVHLFIPETEEEKKNRGELVVALAVSGLGGVAAVSYGRGVLGRLKEEYYSEKGENAFEGLRLAVGGAGESGSEGPGRRDGEEGDGVGLEVAAGAFLEREGSAVVYLAGLGGGGAWVKRGGEAGRVLEVVSGRVAMASGKLGSGDLVVLGSKGFFRVADGVLRAALMTGEAEAAGEMLAPLVEGEGVAGAVVGVVLGSKIVAERVAVGEDETGEDMGIPAKGARVKLRELVERLTKRRGAIGPVYVGEGGKREKRGGLWLKAVAGVILAMLVASLVLGGKERVRREEERRFGGRVREMSLKFVEGQSLVELNPARARELLSEAKTEAETLAEEGYKGEELDGVMSKVGDVLGTVSGEVKIQPSVYMDLSLIREDMKGSRISVSLGKMAVLDQAGRRLVLIDTKTKSTKVAAGGEMVSGAKFAANYGGRGFVLTDKGVIEAGSDSSEKQGTESSRLVALRDENWGEMGELTKIK